MVTHCNHLVPTTFTIFKCPSFVPCSFLDCMGLAFYISRYYFHCIHSLRWSFFSSHRLVGSFFLHAKTFSAASLTEVKSFAKGLGDLPLLLHGVLHRIEGMDQWRNCTNEPLQWNFQGVASWHRQHILSACIIATLLCGCFYTHTSDIINPIVSI